jgi:hypothetical protein
VRHATVCLYCGATLPADPSPLAAPAPEDPLAPLVRACFTLLCRCRSRGELGPALPWLDDALAQRFADEIDTCKRSGLVHVIDRVSVGGVQIGEEQAGGRSVRIDAVYAEYWQDERSRMILRGLRSAKPHRITWHLVRDVEAQGGAGDRCRGCGADLGLGVDVKCPYCGLVPSQNRLGYRLRDMRHDDPSAVFVEWKRRLASDPSLGRSVLGDSPTEGALGEFLTALAEALVD